MEVAIMNNQNLRIYSISGAPRGWRVLVALALKGVQYEVAYLSGADREHKAPEFLSINPHGKVPVLEHGDLRLRESLAIISWLDTKFPAKPLFGHSVKDMSEIWTLVALFSDYLLEAVSGVVGPAFAGNDIVPERDTEDHDTMSAAAGLLDAELLQLADRLGDSPFIHGPTPSAADAIAYPEIGRIMRALETRPNYMAAAGFDDFDSSYPSVATWRDRVAALPGVAETHPPHWRSTPEQKLPAGAAR
jgi:glutathione S-transferase